MHIRIPLVILLLLLSGHVSGSIHAQEATPALTGADLGLPDLEVTITDDGWSLPPEIAAGRYLLTATYDGNEEFGTVAFMRLPEGWSFEDLSAALAAANTEENVLNPDAAASPTALEGTNVEPVGVEEAFAWLYRLTFAGGLSVLAGETSQGVVDLAAGNWAVWSDNFSGEPQALTVNSARSCWIAELLTFPPAAVSERTRDRGLDFDDCPTTLRGRARSSRSRPGRRAGRPTQ